MGPRDSPKGSVVKAFSLRIEIRTQKSAELRLGAYRNYWIAKNIDLISVALSWPMGAAMDLSAWMRELLR